MSDSDLASAPNKFVGYVRTGFDAPDPAVRGSGFVVGGRVVLSAAHVFYNEGGPGWNRATWYWQVAPKPATFDTYSRMMTPRTYRVIAGYAAAVQRVVDSATQLDAFNQDTLALLFYQRVDENGISPLAYDSVAGSGTFSLVGYPAEIGGTTTAWGQMYSHGAGVSATFTRDNPANDYLGNTMVLFETADLLSGGGQSGGPLFRKVDGDWKAVGVTVARNRDYTSLMVRGLDATAHALIDASNADTQTGTVGEIDHGWADLGAFAPPVLRADGSIVAAFYVGTTATLRAFDRNGTELWRRDTPGGGIPPKQLAETPDGRIISFDGGSVTAYQGATGKPLWSTSVYPANSMTVGSRGELYIAGRNITVISPFGQTERVIDNLALPGSQYLRMAIGWNNELYILDDGTLIAVSAAGTKLWQADVKTDDGKTAWVSENTSLAVGPTGRIFVRTDSDFFAYDSDGKRAWHIADPSVPVWDRTIHVLPDGRLLTLRWSVAVLMNADGQELRRFPVDQGALHIAMDAQETLYVSDGTSVRAISDTADRNWTNTHTGGWLYLGAGNQLCVRDVGRQAFLNVILTNAGAAPGLWQGGGGPDQGRRVANPALVAPRILTPPAAANVARGYRLELSVQADGSFPLTFEWRHDGKIVPDAFGSQMVIPYAADTDAGTYTVTVRNGAGTITSAPVSVSVNVAKFGDPVWSTTLSTVATPAVGVDGTTYALFYSKDSHGIGNSTVSLAAFDKGGNELWRTEVGTVGSAWYEQRNPILGDDGTVFVACDGAVAAVSSSGAIRWKKDYSGTGVQGAPYLALGTGNRLYALLERTLSLPLVCYQADGTQSWSVDLKPFGGTAGQPLVRRDGSVVARPMLLVSRSGAVAQLDKQYRVAIIGPNDEVAACEEFAGSAGGRVKIFDSGQTLLSQSTALMGNLVLLTSSGNLIGSGGTSLRFCGNSTTPLKQPSFTRTVLADLGQERLLTVQTDGSLQVWDHASTVVQSAMLPAQIGSNLVLSNDGVLIGGYVLQAWRVGAGPANSPWPLPGADARQTCRAPAICQWQVSAPQSAAVSAPDALYAGYSAVFSANVDGVGPFAFQWQRDGVDLAGQTQQTLSFTNPSEQSSGHYRVIVSNSAGTIYSADYVAQFAIPSAAPAGFYAGSLRDNASGKITGDYAALVHSDRTIEFLTADLSGGNATAHGDQIGPDGTFPSGPYYSADTLRFSNGRIDFGSRVTVEPIDTGVARAANGLPVGFYRGGGADGSGHRAYAAVLPDGRVLWAYNAWGGAVSLADTTLSFSGSIPWSGGTMNYTLTASSDGVLRLSRPASDYDRDLPALGMVWDGRPRTEHLVNLSTRAWISPAWPPLIAGFVMNGQRQLLVRGVGPTLASLGLPSSSVLAHPRLRLMSSAGVTLTEATRWADASNQTELRNTAGKVGAFPLVEGSDDAALLRGFTDPLYSTLLDGADGGTGIALVEVYDADTTAPGSLLNLSSRGYAGSGDNVLIGGFVIAGTGPKTLLIRGIGPGLAPFIGQANFSLVANPRLRIFNEAGKEIASNQMWWTGDQSHLTAVTKQVGAFSPDNNDSAVLITLEPGVYSAIVDANGGTPGVVLLELYDVP